MLKKRWFVLLALFVILSISCYAQFYAGTPRDDADLNLYDINNSPVGTANPSSEGRAQAIYPGALLNINISNVQFNNAVNTGGFVTVDIRQASTVLQSLNGTVFNGTLQLLFTVPLSWDGNYHVRGYFSFNNSNFTKQNEFKVQGNATNQTNQTNPNCTAEICDGIDNDCDGNIDEGLAQQCGTSNVGACTYGVRMCVSGQWGTCQNSTDPDTESCNGIDDDCDGSTDENLVQSCGTDTGACSTGNQACSGGQWSSCGGTFIGPANESCNSIDDDCDGNVDEDNVCASCTDGQTRVCGTDTGACSTGNQTCSGGQWGLCTGAVDPVNETCNSVDDDCDGFIDESLARQCGQYFQGACSLGTESCSGGVWGQCAGAVNPTQETCNNLDDDCDGQIDESLSQSCGITNIGTCRLGTMSCSAGSWSNCSGNVDPVQESCGDSLDNDCDGNVDNGCNQTTCFPSLEICDSIDNDCDGNVDESLSRPCGCSCASANVLMILDDNNHNEDTDDFTQIYNDLVSLQINVTRMNEPSDGVNYSLLQNYDLVWFSNPGWPMDDNVSLQALKQYFDAGNPVVLQGDDMTWGMGTVSNASMQSFTLLANVNNGRDRNYSVKFEDTNHPLLSFLRNKSFVYVNDDIDTSTVASSSLVVLANSTCQTDSNYKGPAIVVRDETSLGKGILLVNLLTMKEIYPDWQRKTFTGNIVGWLLNKAGKCTCGTNVGACQIGMQICSSGIWGQCSGVPPIPEICNAIDDDCDSQIDESLNCQCTEGQTQVCGTDVGACQSGTQSCSGGQWGLCVGAVNPSTETCGNNIDDDCDSLVDEGCTCADADSDSYLDILCGGNDCDDTNSAVNPGALESCNNADDNCNNNIDENLMRGCGTGLGICRTGLQMCTAGIWGTCAGAVLPQTEICNNLDDDCNGIVDDNLTQTCGTDVGECSAGTQTCGNGSWSFCGGAFIGPVNETCNSLDDDCDGLADNIPACAVCSDGDTRACGTDVGECSAGTQTCSNSQWGACEGAVEPSAEMCDYLDNDCDGYMDEELTRQCGTTDTGACAFGTQSCVVGMWSNCTGGIEPADEACNNLDDDCDGYADESLMRNCGTTDVGECQYGTQTCDGGNWSLCQGSIEPAAEICTDTLDNDCNGAADDCATAAPAPSGGGGGGGGGGGSGTKVIKQENKPVLLYKLPQSYRELMPTLEEAELGSGLVPRLDLLIIKYPQLVDVSDSSFIIEAAVVNTGRVPVFDIDITADTTFGWQIEPAHIAYIGINEKQDLVLKFSSTLCSKEQPKQLKFSERMITSSVTAKSGDAEDTETFAPLINAPALSLASAKTDFSKDNTMRACFFVSNPSSAPKTMFEIEFEMYDQKQDILLDYITPVRVGANETLIKSRDYKISVPENKEYNLRANLFENGSIFSEGYSAGESKGVVDLSQFEKQESWLSRFWKKVSSITG